MPRRIPTFRPQGPSIANQWTPPPTENEAEAKKFLNSTAWKRLRAAFLRENPLCEECLKRDKLTPSTIAHHVQERAHNPGRALDSSNLMPLCSPCHTRYHKSRKPRFAEVPPVHPPFAHPDRLTLALDFNGVVHNHAILGPAGKGPILPGSPEVPGAIDFLKRSVETFALAILSARFSRPGAAGLESMIEARTWLIGHGIDPDWITFDPDRSGRIFLTGSKVPYLVALDDRSIRFTGEFPNTAALLAFKPWNVG